MLPLVFVAGQAIRFVLQRLIVQFARAAITRGPLLRKAVAQAAKKLATSALKAARAGGQLTKKAVQRGASVIGSVGRAASTAGRTAARVGTEAVKRTANVLGKVGRVTGRVAGKAAKQIGKRVAAHAVKEEISQKMENDEDKKQDAKREQEHDENQDAIREKNGDKKRKLDRDEEAPQAQQDAMRINSDGEEVISGDNLAILKSILFQTKRLKDTLKWYEKKLYEKEQTDEAKQAEKFVEGDRGIKTKKKEPKKDREKAEGGLLSKIIGFIAFGLFAFLPLLLTKVKSGIEFFKQLPDKIKDIFDGIVKSLKNTLESYIIDPIVTLFSETIPNIWDSITSSIKEAMIAILNAPVSALNALQQFGDQTVINAIDKIVKFVDENRQYFFGAADTIISKAKEISDARQAHKDQLGEEEKNRKKKLEDEKETRAKNLQARKEARAKETQARREAKAEAEKPKEEGKPVLKVTPGKPSGPIPQAKAANAKELAATLRKLGLTSDASIAAIIATASKESGLNPAAKEAGARAWYNTAKSKGNDYMWKIFPQLRPGGRVAKIMGYPNGVPKDAFMDLASKGDAAFFEVMYGEKDAHKYLGRGFIQITGKANYEKIGKMIGIDLVENPDLVAENFEVASAALLAYMANSVGQGNYEKGIKTLNSLSDYDTALKVTIANVASGGFGGDVAKAEKAFASGSGMGENLRHQMAKANEFGSQAAEIAAASGKDINEASMAAKVEAPQPASTVVVAQAPQQAPQQVSTADTSKGASAPNPQKAQGLYQMHLAAARA